MEWILRHFARIWWHFENKEFEDYNNNKDAEKPKYKKRWVRVIYRDGSPLITRYYLFNTRWVEDCEFLKKYLGWISMNLVIHQMFESDGDCFHDHPWTWASWVLATGYFENTPKGRFWRAPGHLRFRSAKAFHRLELDPAKEPGSCWTLFLMLRRLREWGFLEDDGSWIPWYNHVDKPKVQHV